MQADFLLERNDALIIESFGVGGLPEAGGFYDCVRRWMEAGRVVVLTTQVENEGSDLGVYHVGYRLKSDLGVLEAYDMTTEAVVAKLMWILGQTRRAGGSGAAVLHTGGPGHPLARPVKTEGTDVRKKAGSPT